MYSLQSSKYIACPNLISGGGITKLFCVATLSIILSVANGFPLDSIFSPACILSVLLGYSCNTPITKSNFLVNEFIELLFFFHESFSLLYENKLY